MLQERLRNAWRARERAIAISPVLTLSPEGLVLGAGTVLVPADGLHRLQSLEGQEARVLALLSAAYGRAVAPSVLGNIKRAAKAWGEGDDCLAYIHLAHARLPELRDPAEAARRLFIVDGFMKSGTSSRAVFQALGFGAHTSTRSRSSSIPTSHASRLAAAGRAASGPIATKRAETRPRETSRKEMGRTDHLCSGECHLRPPAFWAHSTRHGWLSLPCMPCAFSLRPEKLRQHSGCCSSRLRNNLRVEGEVPEIPGLSIPGTATRPCFI